MLRKIFIDLLSTAVILLFFSNTPFIWAQNSQNDPETAASSQVTVKDGLKNLSLGTFEQSPCSPTIPSSFLDGIIISVPQSDIIIEQGKRAVVPIFGYYLIPVLAAMDGPPLTIQVRPVDGDTVFSGEIVEEGVNEPVEPPPMNAPRPDRDALEGVSTGGYFNIDAQRYLQYNMTPGSYKVIVSFAGLDSNSVLIHITSTK